MARVKFGDGVSGQTGSLNKQLGGVTYLKNGVKRMRVIPVNPQTQGQTETRAAFSFLNAAWATLTDTQRQAWETARLDPYYFVPNDFYGGTRAAASGKALFIQINYNLLQSTGDVDNPSIVTTDPPGVEATDVIGITSLAVDDSSNSVTLTYTGALANDVLVVRLTPAVSAGNMRLTSVKSKLRSAPYTGAASPATITKPTGFVYTGETGQKVFYVIEAIGTVSGKKRVLASGSTLVVA